VLWLVETRVWIRPSKHGNHKVIVRFFISCFVLGYFHLKFWDVRHLGYIFYLINGSFGDVATGIDHIKVFVADQILIGRCFKDFEWSWYFEGQTGYSFECKMVSVCLDQKYRVTPVVTWHAYLQKSKMADISFLAVKTFVEVSKIWKNGKRVFYVLFKTRVGVFYQI
jgi:hypothetical protein